MRSRIALTLSATLVIAVALSACAVVEPREPRAAPPLPPAPTSAATAGSNTHLLLLSGGAGALPDFLDATVSKPLDEITVGYIGDAAAPYDDAPYDTWEHERLTDLGLRVIDIPVTGRSLDDITTDLDSVDALYVGGGNTFYLLQSLRSAGADAVIADRVRAGMPYIGLSAGAIVTGPSILPISVMDDPDDAPDLPDDTGLDLIPNVVVPHADGAEYSLDIIDTIVARFADAYSLLLLDDDQAVLVDGDSVTVVPSA